MDKIIDGYISQGVLGLTVVGLAWYIFFLHNMYAKAQKELVDRTEKSQQLWQEIAKGTQELVKSGQDVLRDNTAVLNIIQTMMETIRQK